MLVVGTAFFLPILLYRFRLKFIPVVVAEILAGIIIGQSGLNLISADPWLELLSLLGFIYLMFLSGLEIDFSGFNKSEGSTEGQIKPFKIALLIFLGILFLSFCLSYLFLLLGFVEIPYLTTLIISTISLGVVVPVLKEKKLMERNLGQTILLIAVISDFATIVLLAIYVAFVSDSAASALWILLLFVFVFISYYGIKFFYKGSHFKKLREGTVQIGTRAVFALILIFVALSEQLGAEHILGAFLAGVIVSLLRPRKEFIKQLDSFGYGFLIPIFFVMIGVKFDLWTLFEEPSTFIFIPILLLALYLSKMIPILILKKWFTWKEVLGSGVLLTSTLSLVIAAVEIGKELNLITNQLYSAFILVAILTCIISPIIFGKLVPKTKGEDKKISIVGANGITLPLSVELKKSNYEVRLFGVEQPKVEPKEEINYGGPAFSIIELPELSPAELDKVNAFQTDTIILGTSYDDLNEELGRYANNKNIKHIIVRSENMDSQEKMKKEGFTVFSTIYAARTLLRAYVESPSALKLIDQRDETLQEIEFQNPKYQHILLRHLPFLGDTLILRIYRGDTSIIPHGDTTLISGDKLLVSGSTQHIQRLRRELE